MDIRWCVTKEEFLTPPGSAGKGFTEEVTFELGFEGW